MTSQPAPTAPPPSSATSADEPGLLLISDLATEWNVSVERARQIAAAEITPVIVGHTAKVRAYPAGDVHVITQRRAAAAARRASTARCDQAEAAAWNAIAPRG